MRLKLLGLTLALSALPVASGAQAPNAGEGLYADNCAACHQPQGQGVPGGPFPALAGNVLVGGPPEVLMTTVLMGRGGMPAFSAELTDDDLAAVLTFVRGAWGNHAAPIAPADVAAARANAAAAAQQKGLQAH